MSAHLSVVLDIVSEPILPTGAAFHGFVARIWINLLLDLAPPRVTINLGCLFEQRIEIRLQLYEGEGTSDQGEGEGEEERKKWAIISCCIKIHRD